MINYAKTFLPYLSSEVQQRLDSVAFARSFEYLEKDLQEIEFAPLKSEQFIPYDTSVPDGALTVTYRTIEQTGRAEFVNQYADDLPYVDVDAKEYQVGTQLLGEQYFWTVQELDSVALDPTIRLDAERKQSAVDAMRRKHDEIAAIGSAAHGRTGFVNDANVPMVTPITGTWGTATEDQIIADVRKLVDAVRIATKDNHMADTVLVDDTSWTRLGAPYGADKTTTLRKWLLDNVDGLKEIAPWSRLNLANAAGNGPRLVAYHKSPQVVRYFSVTPFKERAPQDKGLKVVVPCYARTGFTNIRRPLAVAYMDGV